jgi:hypothetical protein
MRWGENKNAHPKHGTDVRFASVVPPNLGRLYVPASLTWLYNGSIPSPLVRVVDPFRFAAWRSIRH